MNPRIFALGLALLTISCASAFGIIGATDAPPESYEYLILEEVLLLAESLYGDIVSQDIKGFSEVTDDDLRNNIVILVKNGRVIISVPEDIHSSIIEYLEQLEAWIGPYLPFMRSEAEDLIDSGLEEPFTIGCFKSDSGIYEAGVTTGVMEGQTVPAVYEDVCISDLLIEYACEDDYVVRLEILCDEGCEDGACVRPSGAETQDLPEEEERRRGSGSTCDTYWHWTRNGFICFRPDVPAEEVVPEPPASCHGCVSGERCMLFGERLPDNRSCTGIGFTCLGCELDGACIPNRASAPDGRVCVAGELKDTAPRPPPPEPTPAPEPERVEPDPIEDVFAPEPSESRGLFAVIADFFRNLFSRS